MGNKSASSHSSALQSNNSESDSKNKKRANNAKTPKNDDDESKENVAKYKSNNRDNKVAKKKHSKKDPPVLTNKESNMQPPRNSLDTLATVQASNVSLPSFSSDVNQKDLLSVELEATSKGESDATILGGGDSANKHAAESEYTNINDYTSSQPILVQEDSARQAENEDEPFYESTSYMDALAKSPSLSQLKDTPIDVDDLSQSKPLSLEPNEASIDPNADLYAHIDKNRASHEKKNIIAHERINNIFSKLTRNVEGKVNSRQAGSKLSTLSPVSSSQLIMELPTKSFDPDQEYIILKKIQLTEENDLNKWVISRFFIKKVKL